MDDKLKQINIENIIIYIYFILLLLYLYANKIEVNYLNNQNYQDKENYRTILFIVFGINLIITLYYTIESFKELNTNQDENIKYLKELSALASLLILIASIIILYITYKDTNIDLEISP